MAMGYASAMLAGGALLAEAEASAYIPVQCHLTEKRGAGVGIKN
jgi:hypothetical protein